MENISKAQERQKKEYNARHQPLQFQEGDVVLLRNMRNEARKGGKLERAWCGPYTISAVLPKGLYRLRNDDSIINRAQEVLRGQFNNIGGWQDPLLCQTSFSAAVDESIQIHFTGQNHWVCSTSIGGLVRVYDSSSCKKLTPSMEVQLSECYRTAVKDRNLEVEMPSTQIQQGGVDCGLFAIAFACELAFGNDPSTISYDQSQMRKHLLSCLQKRFFTPFPRQSKSARFSKGHICCINLFCNCNMPESWDDMIQCDLCHEWLHMTCEGIQTTPTDEWLCSVCRPRSFKRSRKQWWRTLFQWPIFLLANSFFSVSNMWALL